MKNLLPAIFILIGFVSCNNKSDESNAQMRNIQLLSDSAAYTNNVFSDTNSVADAETIPVKAVSNKVKPAKRSIIHSTQPVVTEPVTHSTGVANSSTAEKQVTDSPINPDEKKSETVSSETSDNSPVASTTGQQEVKKKKGLNKAAQGAIIGGVTGAVGGAIISKKKGVGAVVGAVVGAAGGYIIGKKMDKKDKKENNLVFQ